MSLVFECYYMLGIILGAGDTWHQAEYMYYRGRQVWGRGESAVCDRSVRGGLSEEEVTFEQ